MVQRRFCAESTAISCAAIESSRIAPRPSCSVTPDHRDDAGRTETADNEQLTQRASRRRTMLSPGAIAAEALGVDTGAASG